MDLEPFARRLRAKRLQAIDTSLQARRQTILPTSSPAEPTIELPRERVERADPSRNRFQ